jgi:hypothetical protein
MDAGIGLADIGDKHRKASTGEKKRKCAKGDSELDHFGSVTAAVYEEESWSPAKFSRLAL